MTERNAPDTEGCSLQFPGPAKSRARDDESRARDDKSRARDAKSRAVDAKSRARDGNSRALDDDGQHPRAPGAEQAIRDPIEGLSPVAAAVGVKRRRRTHQAPAPVELLDFAPVADDLLAEVLAGLGRPRKALPCKLFYDARGAELFERICDQPEYYPTRTELRILRQHAPEIAAAAGRGCVLVEYGSGSSLKTRLLLDHLDAPAAYVPIDISRAQLLRCSRALAASYPGLSVRPVCADYTGAFHLPEIDGAAPRAASGTPRAGNSIPRDGQSIGREGESTSRDERPMSRGSGVIPSDREPIGRAGGSARERSDSTGQIVAFFPGSTIGNFEPDAAVAFLRSIRRVCGAGSALVIGVDLRKDPAILHAAYNDAAGVTAAFNLNLLARLNRELGAGFDLDGFAHRAFYDPRAGRVEMHLVSRRPQQVALGAGAPIAFAEGETIHTENCYKYTIPAFHNLAAAAGYHPLHVWTDEQRWFSVHYLLAAD